MSKLQKTPPGYEFITSKGGIEEHRLKKNGLRVLTKEDHSFPVAGFMITYFLGSKDEATGKTGATHLLEHMAFKGMEGKDGEDFDSQFERVGGQLNGTTWADRTNYFEILPSEHIKLAVEAEASRMSNVKIIKEDLKKEMVVVRNELEWGENSPELLLERDVWATAFQAHPYGHLTIGWRSDVENIETKTLQNFYENYYTPNNAVVTVMGDINTKEILTKIKKHFSSIENRSEPPRIPTIEPEQKGPRGVTTRKKAGANLLSISYKMPPANEEGEVRALQVFAKILSDGVSSLLHDKLVEPVIAIDVTCDAHAFLHEGLFEIIATLAPGQQHQKAEKIILDTLEKIQKEGVTKEQVDMAKSKILSDSSFEKDDMEKTLMGLNENIATGNWKNFVEYPQKIKKLSATQVNKVVNKYFRENKKTTAHFVAQ